jgi:hypothetical protein
MVNVMEDAPRAIAFDALTRRPLVMD